MVYIDGAYDSKAYGSINHFEIPLSGIRGHVTGHNQKKDTHTLDFDVTLSLGLKQLTSLIFHFGKGFLAKNVLMTAQRDFCLGNSLVRRGLNPAMRETKLRRG